MILHFTDIHFRKDVFALISREAKRLRADVCISGDLLDQGTASEGLRQQADWVRQWIAQQDCQLFLCSGNHDEDHLTSGIDGWVRALHDGTRVISDGHSATTRGGSKIFCVPYGEVLFLPPAAAQLDAADIIVTHAGPAGTDVATGMDGRDFGDLDLKDYLDGNAVKRRRLILCGHIHTPVAHSAKLGKVLAINPGFKNSKGTVNYSLIDDVRMSATIVSPTSIHGNGRPANIGREHTDLSQLRST